MRWIDPAPQSGLLTLDTPFDKQVIISFERKTSTAIGVNIEGPQRSFDFTVRTLPAASE
jgi:hypothetical protein